MSLSLVNAISVNSLKQSVKQALDSVLFSPKVDHMTSKSPHPSTIRLYWLDYARGIAVIAMVIFHITFDLMYFGYIPQGTVYRLEWRLFETAIAGSFLFIAGLSFMLAHGIDLRFRALKRKIGLLALAAGGISIVTYFIFGPYMIRMGILHTILLMSVLAIGLRQLHWVILALLSIGILTIYFMTDLPIAAPSWLQWMIVTTKTEFSVDYRPLVPWSAPFLLGMVTFRFISKSPVPNEPIKALSFLGQNSLWIYLAHQPVLFGLFNLFSWLRA
jgi:uncharacterized membrane protein